MEDLGGLASTSKEEGVEVFALSSAFLQVLSALSNIVLKDFLQEHEVSYIRKNLMF